MEDEKTYRIVGNEDVIYTLEQLKHMKNNDMINADTLIKCEDTTLPAGALFDFQKPSPFAKNDPDVNALGVISIVLIFICAPIGLITSIIGYRMAVVRGQDKIMPLIALVINGVITLIMLSTAITLFILLNGNVDFDMFKNFSNPNKWTI